MDPRSSATGDTRDTSNPGTGDRPRLRGWLHLYAFAVSLAGGLTLVAISATRPDRTALWSCALYAVTVCGLFGISALYHRRHWGSLGHAVMKRLDHSMIFIFIAGSYTPFCVLLLPATTAILLLTLVWAGALSGVGVKMFWPHAPRWVGVPMYITLGWAAVFVLPDILTTAGVAPLVLMITGGVLYSLGGVSYATKWPNLWPATFGYHEFFHACTLLAAICHQVAVYFALYA